MTPPPSRPFHPLPEEQRLHLLDALRGFALFGILLVNMAGFKMPFVNAFTGEPHLPGAANLAAMDAIRVFAAGKFVSIFALLFGIGLVMQEKRATAAGRPFRPFIRRRMAILLLLGAAHGIFLWAGDILAIYALFGLLAPRLLGRSPKRLLFLAGILFSLLLAFLVGMEASYPYDYSGSDAAEWKVSADAWIESYRTGTFSDIVRARSMEWGIMWGIAVFTEIPYAFCFFLLGIALGKTGFLSRFDEWRPRLSRFAIIAFPLGLALALLSIGHYRSLLPPVPGLNLLAAGAYMLSPAILTFVYLIAFISFFLSGRAPFLRRRLEETGRLSLSNYLFQSLAANLLFMSWGFALYGKVPAQTGILIAVLLYSLQILLSHLWLRRFTLGPMEWIWRKLSYKSF